MSKNARVGALSRPTSIYRRTPSNIAVRHLKQLQSRRPDALVAWTGRASPITDRTHWSSLSSAPTNQRSDALVVAPDATVPASGWSPVSTQNDRTRPIACDRTRRTFDLLFATLYSSGCPTGHSGSTRDRTRWLQTLTPVRLTAALN
jgi:hypothetical protein